MSEQIEYITIYGMKVDPQTYYTLKNFAEDLQIPNFVDRENMLCEVALGYGLLEPKRDQSQAVFMDELQFIEAESDDGSRRVLLLSGVSGAIEDKAFALAEEIEGQGTESIGNPEDWQNATIPFSFDLKQKEVNIDFLNAKIGEYTQGKVIFSELITKYCTEENYLNYVMDGMTPET